MGGTHENHDVRRYSLEELGIISSTNSNGENKLTIALAPHQLFGIAEAQVVFNPTLSKWELSTTSHLKLKQTVNVAAEQNNTPRLDAPPEHARWTDTLPKTKMVEALLNNPDWNSSPLGPLVEWPYTLQVCLNLVFTDSQAAVIYWGDQLCALYNDEYIKMISDRLTKTDGLGTPFVKLFPELWADFEPMLQGIAARGTGCETLEVSLFPVVDGVPEEIFFEGTFLPIRDETGSVKGFYNRAREITKSLIRDRRAKVLSAIAAKPNLTGDFIFKHLVSSFGQSDRDFPLAFVYSAHEDITTGKCLLRLECGEGLPKDGHPLVPHELELFEGHVGFTPHFRRAKSKDQAIVLHTADGTLPDDLIAGFQWKGFGEPSRSLAILPLATSNRLLAVLVIGLNPRRPYDEEYEGFLQTLMRSSSATVASAIDREEARHRAERLARQLEDGEKSIREMAEYGPVGIARYTLSGKMEWANDAFYVVTGHGREEEDHYEMSLLDLVINDDRQRTMDAWTTLAVDKASVNFTARARKTWQPPSDPETGGQSEEENVWILVSGYPMMGDRDIKAYALSVSDISRFKWAEQVQTRMATAAKEAKRLQENFIDIVSHEMRNPLSAITQLSDAISSSIEDFDHSKGRAQDARDILNSNAENAKTILMCAAHQKTIIDDVLTLSKLDSMMLSITPVAVQPYKIVQSVLKMFEAEFVANNIQVKSEKTQDYLDQKVDWITLDPSRLTQIFINLITNAVKFTKLESERKIMVRVGVVEERPPSLAGIRWFPSNKKYKDLTLSPEWGTGAPVHVCFEVQDTGRGLEQDEMNKLFGRFQQATERTHLTYGGSGLGLFISRELTETQGGEIGVRSTPGKGTTFAFYVKGRKIEPPDHPAQIPQPTMLKKTPRTLSSEAQQQLTRQTSNPPSPGRSHVVLLVEDNIVNSKVLKKQLAKAGCIVYVAHHGVEALDILRTTKAWEGPHEGSIENSVDVVLMDVEMPIMDGLTCTRRIRQLEAEGQLNQHINIIGITANARQEQRDTVIQAGADDVLPKPFKVTECLELIAQVLDRNSRSVKELNGK